MNVSLLKLTHTHTRGTATLHTHTHTHVEPNIKCSLRAFPVRKKKHTKNWSKLNSSARAFLMRNLLTYFRAQHALVGVCKCTGYTKVPVCVCVCEYVGLIAAAPAVGVALPQLDNKMQDTWACKLWKTPASSRCNGYWNAHTHTHTEKYTHWGARTPGQTYIRTYTAHSYAVGVYAMPGCVCIRVYLSLC